MQITVAAISFGMRHALAGVLENARAFDNDVERKHAAAVDQRVTYRNPRLGRLDGFRRRFTDGSFFNYLFGF
ncbi:MAG: hypothetical protein ACO22T_00890 [Burkholderiales bacterium]